MSKIVYEINGALTTEEFISVLKASTLAERRPVEDQECMEGMLEHANLIVTARVDGQLIAVARSVTDFHYCCYLSDIAVAQSDQNQGIGRNLLRLTKNQLSKRCKLILLSAPAAVGYYQKCGFKQHPQAWLLAGDDAVQ